MKLIIDISNDFKDYIEDVLMGVGDSTGILVEAVMDGIPLEEELEYLKADIRFRGYYDERIEDLIDEHISELKGENK